MSQWPVHMEYVPSDVLHSYQCTRVELVLDDYDEVSTLTMGTLKEIY